MKTKRLLLLTGAACLLCAPLSRADDTHQPHSASGHAPIGVMGDHMHKKGEWMLGYRFMRMDMEGNRDGTDRISAEEIATSVPNRFFGAPMQPATLRVVPTEMTMDMHMVSVMYAPSDDITLMAMGHYVEKEMDHIVFQGGAGANVLGGFTTETSGIGDTHLMASYRAYEQGGHHLQINMGLSLPTGSIDETDQVLTPMNARPTIRLPYSMQLGTGTYDLLPGVSYSGWNGKWGWGAQYKAQIPLESENDEGYRWDDKHTLTAWGSYEWARWISTSLRLTGVTQGAIRGIDPNIVAPVQTANPDNYGGETLELGAGVNLYGTEGASTDHRFAIEATVPFYRDLKGPQMETDFTVTAGWQYAF